MLSYYQIILLSNISISINFQYIYIYIYYILYIYYIYVYITNILAYYPIYEFPRYHISSNFAGKVAGNLSGQPFRAPSGPWLCRAWRSMWEASGSWRQVGRGPRGVGKISGLGSRQMPGNSSSDVSGQKVVMFGGIETWNISGVHEELGFGPWEIFQESTQTNWGFLNGAQVSKSWVQWLGWTSAWAVEYPTFLMVMKTVDVFSAVIVDYELAHTSSRDAVFNQLEKMKWNRAIWKGWNVVDDSIYIYMNPRAMNTMKQCRCWYIYIYDMS